MSRHGPSRSARVCRLLADLRRGHTRGEAIGRIRRRPGTEVRKRAGSGPPPNAMPAAGAGGGSYGRRHDAWEVGEWAKLADAVMGVPASDADDAMRWKDAQKVAARRGSPR